jgi:hypothetical protein
LKVESNADNLNDATEAMQTGSFEQATLRSINVVVSSGNGSSLICEVLFRARSAGNDEARAIQQLMRNLEALAVVSPTSARLLMATLWPAASRLHLHDVCDAIDLWIANGMSDELKQQLLRVAESERDHGGRKHLEQMLRHEP